MDGKQSQSSGEVHRNRSITDLILLNDLGDNGANTLGWQKPHVCHERSADKFRKSFLLLASLFSMESQYTSFSRRG